MENVELLELFRSQISLVSFLLSYVCYDAMSYDALIHRCCCDVVGHDVVIVHAPIDQSLRTNSTNYVCGRTSHGGGGWISLSLCIMMIF
jgi:hypothetical protein